MTYSAVNAELCQCGCEYETHTRQVGTRPTGCAEHLWCGRHRPPSTRFQIGPTRPPTLAPPIDSAQEVR